MSTTLPPYEITDITWDNDIMIVTFKNGAKIKFIGINERQYTYVVCSSNPKKELEKLK